MDFPERRARFAKETRYYCLKSRRGLDMPMSLGVYRKVWRQWSPVWTVRRDCQDYSKASIIDHKGHMARSKCQSQAFPIRFPCERPPWYVHHISSSMGKPAVAGCNSLNKCFSYSFACSTPTAFPPVICFNGANDNASCIVLFL